MNRRIAKLALVLIVFAPGLGCSNTGVRMPRFGSPGPAGYQRYNATQRVDPYPLPDAGPEVVGGRPREFQAPVPEVERARAYSQRQATRFTAPPLQPTYANPSYPAY